MTERYIHPNAQIGKNVKIGQFCFIDEDVIIGDDTVIEPNVIIYRGARIGKNCRIFPGAVIAAEPQDLKFGGEYTTVEIGDYTTLRECVTVNRGTKASGTTKIGNHNLIMAYCHIAHDCVIHDHCVLSNSTNLAGHITIEDYAILGGMCGVHQFTKIGKHAFVGGGSMLRKDVPPYVIVAKDPTAYTGINSIGLKRRGFSNTEIHLIQDLYRYIYLSDLNVSQAIEKILTDFETSEIRDEVVNFIQNSERGIVRGIN
ncbi:MAG: acyl-ACP--UDP-N-acetylglucosamine O-acyltransferase [Chitinophagales bacterium]|nr:acyl-ACP--UDP-N-acetylglucosamine O-acyltransferase [Chitinophagales bacterium]